MTRFLALLQSSAQRSRRAGAAPSIREPAWHDAGVILTLIGVALVSGIALAVWPIASLCALVVLFGLTMLLRMPRPLVVLFLAFIIVQDPLRLVFRGDDTAIGFVVKRLDEATLFALTAWVLISNRLTSRALRAHGIGLVILACYMSMIVSSFLAHVQLLPALMDLALFSKPFLLFVIGTSVVLESEEIERGVRPALLMMLAVVLFAVVFMAFPALQDSYIGDIRRPDVRIGLVSAQGFFDGPGPYSWFCAATFAIAYAAYLSFSKKFYLYAAGISGVFTLLAWRRKSIIGVVAMLVLATILQGRLTERGRSRALAIVALVALMAMTVLAPYLGGLWSYTLTEYGSDPHSIARFALHYTSVQIAIDHFPFGTGLATFASHASRVYYSDVYYSYGLANVWGLSPEYPEFITDTFWPMVLGEGGIVALVAYVGFFALLTIHFWRAARNPYFSREQRFLLLAAFFLLIGSVSESTSSHIYDSTMQSALVMIPVGMCWSSFAVQSVRGNRVAASHSQTD
jgi:hypothetical protein